MSIQAALKTLVGEEVNGVCFVMDYIELHFNGPVLRLLADPTLSHEGRRLTFPDADFSHAVRELIRERLTAIRGDDNQLELQFTGGRLLSVSLDPASNPTGESLHYIAEPGGDVQIW